MIGSSCTARCMSLYSKHVNLSCTLNDKKGSSSNLKECFDHWYTKWTNGTGWLLISWVENQIRCTLSWHVYDTVAVAIVHVWNNCQNWNRPVTCQKSTDSYMLWCFRKTDSYMFCKIWQFQSWQLHVLQNLTVTCLRQVLQSLTVTCLRQNSDSYMSYFGKVCQITNPTMFQFS